MDNKNLIKKVMTLKSGQFVFSGFHDDRTIAPMLARARTLYLTIGELPILPEQAAGLQTELIRRSIFGTAALEGNPLSEAQVALLLEEPDTFVPLKRSDQEIINLKKAYGLLASSEKERVFFPVEEDFIKDMHEQITVHIQDTHNLPGKYRNHRVEVGDAAHGGIFVPPKILPDIQTLMRELALWLNSDPMQEVNLTMRAALAHFHLAKIHPFGDGNGRTARLLEAVILARGGVKFVPTMLSNYYYQNIDAYFSAFRAAEKKKDHDVTPFLEFFYIGLIESLLEIKDRVTRLIRQLTLKDYYRKLKDSKKLTKRQFDLLRVLLEYDQPFTRQDLFIRPVFRILYSKVSENTARRDLIKLTDKGLLLKKGQEYRLHLKVLG